LAALIGNSEGRTNVDVAETVRSSDLTARYGAEECAFAALRPSFETVPWADIETCPACGGAVRILACIENPVGT